VSCSTTAPRRETSGIVSNDYLAVAVAARTPLYEMTVEGDTFSSDEPSTVERQKTGATLGHTHRTVLHRVT
jgi:hypothetical protein